MCFKVALIGAGNLGSRHLQALKLTQRKIKITVCEPNEKARLVAQNRYSEYKDNSYIQNICYIENFKMLQEKQDLVIIATSAQERYEIASWCVENLSVKYLLLEKIVFQRLQDFENFKKKIKNKNIKVWVNCPRRMYDFYKTLRKRIGKIEKLDMIVSGSSWGLGCNSIHILDLYLYLTQCNTYEYDITNLDNGYFESKRNGYIEFSGELIVKTEKGRVILKSYKDGSIPSGIFIDSKKIRGQILEEQGKGIIQCVDNNWSVEEVKFNARYQSSLTNKVVEQLIDSGTCELTNYEDTIILHKIILSAFLKHLNKNLNNEVERCPIT